MRPPGTLRRLLWRPLWRPRPARPPGDARRRSATKRGTSAAATPSGAAKCPRGASNAPAPPLSAQVILEINTRVGGDLAKDVPRPRAAAFFEALDALGGGETPCGGGGVPG